MAAPGKYPICHLWQPEKIRLFFHFSFVPSSGLIDDCGQKEIKNFSLPQKAGVVIGFPTTVRKVKKSRVDGCRLPGFFS
ncbi:MAG: hypothetical protein ACK2U0_06245 [Candidatus Promineifilaceae bacterium]